MYKREEIRTIIDRSDEIEVLEQIQELINSKDFSTYTTPFNCNDINCKFCPYAHTEMNCMVSRLKELVNLMRKNAVDFARQNM